MDETEKPPHEAPASADAPPESDAPESDAPESDAPESDAPESDAPESDAPESDAPESDAPESDAPESDAPESDAPESDAPESDAPESDAPESDAPESDAPESDAPESDAPESDAPESDAPESDAPESDAPESDAPESDAPESDAPRWDAPEPSAAAPENGEAEAGQDEPDDATEGQPEAAEPAELSPDEQIAALKDRLLRAMAEAENARKRAARDRDDAAKYAITDFARDVLGVADNLRRAIGSVPDEARGGGEALDNLLTGVDLTERELEAVLDRHGIKPINPGGEKFDPNRHQAMFETPSADAAPGTIVQVLQIGYMIADRLLRPAAVGVAAAPPPAEQVAHPEGDGGSEDSPDPTPTSHDSPTTFDTKV